MVPTVWILDVWCSPGFRTLLDNKILDYFQDEFYILQISSLIAVLIKSVNRKQGTLILFFSFFDRLAKIILTVPDKKTHPSTLGIYKGQQNATIRREKWKQHSSLKQEPNQSTKSIIDIDISSTNLLIHIKKVEKNKDFGTWSVTPRFQKPLDFPPSKLFNINTHTLTHKNEHPSKPSYAFSEKKKITSNQGGPHKLKKPTSMQCQTRIKPASIKHQPLPSGEECSSLILLHLCINSIYSPNRIPSFVIYPDPISSTMLPSKQRNPTFVGTQGFQTMSAGEE